MENRIIHIRDLINMIYSTEYDDYKISALGEFNKDINDINNKISLTLDHDKKKIILEPLSTIRE